MAGKPDLKRIVAELRALPPNQRPQTIAQALREATGYPKGTKP